MLVPVLTPSRSVAHNPTASAGGVRYFTVKPTSPAAWLPTRPIARVFLAQPLSRRLMAFSRQPEMTFGTLRQPAPSWAGLLVITPGTMLLTQSHHPLLLLAGGI